MFSKLLPAESIILLRASGIVKVAFNLKQFSKCYFDQPFSLISFLGCRKPLFVEESMVELFAFFLKT